ncbi:Putative SOS response-associated peptidase YedK [Azotobacter beijerinckii]|uniref:Abasic site processing protein n=1 Tax=Azotobacter beijerinckii TaxID=170623 RepID=A0A1H7ATS4_9GAMM|nr:SOS response-associated peptidase family protein [Azotobacter beijerinckii]SEJ65260.1 Putative SOS response-associated peptidase YedK [Azotobacter beijerinckii]
MCGRFVQYRAAIDYLQALRSEAPLAAGIEPAPIARYNVAPHTRVLLIHEDADGLRLEPITWGYAPVWARSPRPPAINARVETLASSRFWREAWKSGRALVPADGWYEWRQDTAGTGRKQPFFFQLKSREPLFFPAVGRFPRGGAAAREGDGFALITQTSEGRMNEIHDRRPLVLEPKMARAWLDPQQTPARAEEITLHRGLPAQAFEWYPVGLAVGNVHNEGVELIRPAE